MPKDGSNDEQARAAIGQAVIKIVEAERWLEDAAALSPAAEDELLRLRCALHQTRIDVLDARDLLEKGES
jgi:hypothetical protein